MKNITMIAAVGKNLELGKDNDLIWHFKEDMKFFKENTINKPIVMGMKTLESLPHLLPKRTHIVLTRQNKKLDNAANKPAFEMTKAEKQEAQKLNKEQQ